MTQIVARILTVQIVRFTFPRSLVVVLFSKNSTHLRVTFPKTQKKQKKNPNVLDLSKSPRAKTTKNYCSLV